jgi:hypothetical protein
MADFSLFLAEIMRRKVITWLRCFAWRWCTSDGSIGYARAFDRHERTSNLNDFEGSFSGLVWLDPVEKKPTGLGSAKGSGYFEGSPPEPATNAFLDARSVHAGSRTAPSCISGLLCYTA